MKKTITTTLLAGALFFAVSANAQQKSNIAHIALDSLLKNMPESDSARKVGQAYYMQLENTIESMQKELQTKNQELQQDGPKLSEIVKQTKQQELQDLYQRIQNFQQQAQGSLQR